MSCKDVNGPPNAKSRRGENSVLRLQRVSVVLIFQLHRWWAHPSPPQLKSRKQCKSPPFPSSFYSTKKYTIPSCEFSIRLYTYHTPVSKLGTLKFRSFLFWGGDLGGPSFQNIHAVWKTIYVPFDTTCVNLSCAFVLKLRSQHLFSLAVAACEWVRETQTCNCWGESEGRIASHGW